MSEEKEMEKLHRQIERALDDYKDAAMGYLSELTVLRAEYEALESEHNDLQDEYEDLLKQNEELSKAQPEQTP